MEWKNLIMHLMNLCAGIILVLKGKDNFAMLVLGGAFGIAAPSAIIGKAKDATNKALDAATSVVNKAGMVFTFLSLAFVLYAFMGCATLKKEGSIAALCALPSPDTVNLAAQCKAQGGDVGPCLALAELEHWLACEWGNHSKGIHTANCPFDASSKEKGW